ncbi:MAG: glycosyl transferase family 2 [Fluviicola sp.]|nr:MAG: glycosyl transferase family 2 [Fluviicola sp.]
MTDKEVSLLLINVRSIYKMVVSILLPFHNAAPWITETVLSIQNQSFEDWELIAINDFSTDDSFKILQGLAENDSRIQLHQNAQKGIIPALQLALSKVTGRFITRMDADDLMPENRLQLMVNRMESLPEKSIVTGKVKYFSDSSLNVSDGYLSYEAWLNERVENTDYYNHIYRECVVASPNWLARTEDIRASNIFSELNYPEDYDMTFRWMKNGFTIHGIDGVTLLWREHPARTSRNSDVYDQESFFNLKLSWFCDLHELNSVAVLGAGVKGKLTAKFLVNRQVDFNWHDLDSAKYGAPIYGKTIQDYTALKGNKLLIAIYPKNKKPLLDYLTEKGFEIGKNAWFL